jgi:nicotinate-nucleotide adenylyltransferase
MNDRSILLFGGTFDPIHHGHLRAALEVMESHPLDRCVLIPAAVPPHKARGDMAGVDHRLAMVRLAAAGVEGLAVSEAEVRRAGPSYTVDTIREFQESLPGDAEILLLLGLDAFFEIDSWHAWQELLGAVPLVVMTRPDGQKTASRQAAAGFLNDRIQQGYRFMPEAGGFYHPHLPTVYFRKVTMLDISSTDIRRRVKSGRSIRFLVPDAVRRYIAEKELYR